MAITLKLVARHMAHWDSRGEYARADAMRFLLYKGLSKQQKAALKLVRESHGWVSTPDICKALNIKPNHGWTLMRDLYDLGLVLSRHQRHVCLWLERKTPIEEGEL